MEQLILENGNGAANPGNGTTNPENGNGAANPMGMEQLILRMEMEQPIRGMEMELILRMEMGNQSGGMGTVNQMNLLLHRMPATSRTHPTRSFITDYIHSLGHTI